MDVSMATTMKAKKNEMKQIEELAVLSEGAKDSIYSLLFSQTESGDKQK